MPKSPEVEAWFKCYENQFGGNLASFNPRSKQHASLFHIGAEIPGKHETDPIA